MDQAQNGEAHGSAICGCSRCGDNAPSEVDLASHSVNTHHLAVEIQFMCPHEPTEVVLGGYLVAASYRYLPLASE
jgi:hypothetical protein